MGTAAPGGGGGTNGDEVVEGEKLFFEVIFGVQRIPRGRVRYVSSRICVWASHSSSMCGLTAMTSITSPTAILVLDL